MIKFSSSNCLVETEALGKSKSASDHYGRLSSWSLVGVLYPKASAMLNLLAFAKAITEHDALT